jgi:deoxyhypusine monooxygenase
MGRKNQIMGPLDASMDRRAQLAAMREASGYTSVDPAPPAVQDEPSHTAPFAAGASASVAAAIAAHRARLLDTGLPMFQRMRAVFALRNAGGAAAVEALCAAFQDPSALLRHEIAYVLGQMQDPHAVPTLIEVLSRQSEHVMVRHEAAEALGAIGDEAAVPVLQAYLSDPNPEVSESCEVALDLIAWVCSDDLEYA